MKRAAIKSLSVLMALVTVFLMMPHIGIRQSASAASQISTILSKAKEISENNPHGYDGLCLGFCSVCYEAAGYPHYNMRTAYEAGTAWIASTSSTNIPVGALVFYDYTWDASAGHVGIYAGRGKMYDAESKHGGVMLRDFKTDGYRGWGWYGNTRPTGDLGTFLLNLYDPALRFVKTAVTLIKNIFSSLKITVA